MFNIFILIKKKKKKKNYMQIETALGKWARVHYNTIVIETEMDSVNTIHVIYYTFYLKGIFNAIKWQNSMYNSS